MLCSRGNGLVRGLAAVHWAIRPLMLSWHSAMECRDTYLLQPFLGSPDRDLPRSVRSAIRSAGSSPSGEETRLLYGTPYVGVHYTRARGARCHFLSKSSIQHTLVVEHISSHKYPHLAAKQADQLNTLCTLRSSPFVTSNLSTESTHGISQSKKFTKIHSTTHTHS